MTEAMLENLIADAIDLCNARLLDANNRVQPEAKQVLVHTIKNLIWSVMENEK